jgi:hypothetical protein
MRVYADTWRGYSVDKFYSDSLGFSIVGSTHGDWNDSCAGAIFGYNEYGEDWFTIYSDNVPNWTVSADFAAFSNFEALRTDGGGNHHWDGNGNVTYVGVP